MLGLAAQCPDGDVLESAECTVRTYEIREVSTFEVCARAQLLWEALEKQVAKDYDTRTFNQATLMTKRPQSNEWISYAESISK
jgi:hypothetical protein